jgi:hypothetical protein
MMTRYFGGRIGRVVIEMREVIIGLKRWYGRLRLWVWLHPEVDVGRRAILLGCAATVGASVLGFVPGSGVTSVTLVNPGSGYTNELMAITRRAFVPRLYVQIWKGSPLDAALLRDA